MVSAQRRTVVLGAALATALIAGAVGLKVCAGESATRACRSVRTWWIWADNPPPPRADNARVNIPLPDDATRGGTLSGVMHYRNGDRGWKGAEDLPARLVSVDFGGVSLEVQDVRWWRPAPDADFLRPARPTVIASICCSPRRSPPRTLASHPYGFDRGGPINLDLAFKITISPLADDAGAPEGYDGPGPLCFEARLGDLRAQCRQRWDEGSNCYTPVIRADRVVSAGVVMVHGMRDECYAETTLLWNDRPLDADECCRDRGTWRLEGEGSVVAARSLVDGMMVP